MYVPGLICLLLVFISLIINRKKTQAGFKTALKKVKSVFLPVIYMIGIVTIVSTLLSEKGIIDNIQGGSLLLRTLVSSLIGSITVMSGFAAFPLCGLLKEQGVPLTVISAFSTSLMMVGIVTFPLEKHYFGTKLAVVRNVVSWLIVLTIAMITGLVFGEIFL